jgi:DNA-binding LacI/PurR family transcriptional regulator
MSIGNLTILDIAREAGVSPATVSRVLAGHPHVSPKTRQAVQLVIDKYNFKPNGNAKGLLQGQTHLLGVIMPDITHPYYASIFSAAQDEANRQGYTVLLHRLAYNAMITDDFIDQLIERRLDGVLLSGGFIESTNPSDLPRVLTRLQQYMPIVTICPPIPGLSCVNIYTDLHGGVAKAVRHLAALGHRHLAFLGATGETRSVGEREQGFYAETRRLGLRATVRHDSIHTPEQGEIATRALLEGLPRVQWPTALIAVNDLMALGALKELRRMGLSVPGDMAVVGCDNQFFSAYTDPPLTTIEVDTEGHGRSALAELLRARAEGAMPFTLVREATLVVRGSCGAGGMGNGERGMKK